MTDAMEFVADRQKGVLATIRRNGRPQLSNIVYAVLDDEIWISVTDDRAKTHNVRRDPRASLHVTSEDFWSYVVVEADAELGPLAEEPGDAGTVQLRELYREIRGEHHDWEEYDGAMIGDRRRVLTLHPRHTYGKTR